MLQDAVIRNLQIMAGSRMRLSNQLKAQHDEVNWSGIAGLRNVVVHDYMDLDMEMFWEVIQGD